MSYFTNPYSDKPQLLSGIFGILGDLLPFFINPAMGVANMGMKALGKTPIGGGTSGAIGGAAANSIMQNQPGPDQMMSQPYTPPQANMIPPGATLGQSPLGQMDPQIMALMQYLRKMGVKV